MAFQNFQVGCKAEAVDDDGVWCRCTVILNENDGVTVSFDGWKSEWNRKICDASQIRTQTAVSGKGKRKHVALSSEVRTSFVFMFLSNQNEIVICCCFISVHLHPLIAIAFSILTTGSRVQMKIKQEL